MVLQDLVVSKTMDGAACRDLADLATRYSGCHITIECGARTANAKSMMGLLSFGLKPGSKIKLSIFGDLEEQAAQKMSEMLCQ
ncbi:MAG: HPr family phosphocarrier protein [Firmicutes bacterium]|nr:HPr family phosphocarrier protein [Bacillota bacterium]